jgi:LPS-assembly lipoprotein|tara:strand:+ start:65539 stop:66042 length:504 start_codon:yes stop_codon:yes gene_type:complete
MRLVRLALAGFVILVSASLAGCGFTPLYGSAGTVSGMSNIRVETGQDRIDFQLQQALLDGMGAHNASGAYTLRAVPTVEASPQGVGVDAIAQRFALEVTVVWEVYRNGTINPVMSGTAIGNTSYDVPKTVYGSLTAQIDAENRAIGVAADRIIAQIARNMRERPGAW